MPNSDKITVLIVDDEEDVLRPIAFRLEALGFSVLLETDGELGFQTAVAKRPDLILLDIMMPGMDGLTLCNALKEREDTAAIPIIILTAKTAVADVEKAFRSGADDYVAKPFEWDEIYGKINRCLAHSASHVRFFRHGDIASGEGKKKVQRPLHESGPRVPESV